MRWIVCFGVAALAFGPASAQNFSCNYGKQPACLDYGAKVCSSLAKCVDQSAACFDSYQCDYEGFTCKSNVTECAEKHDKVLRENRSLVSDYNELLDKAKAIAEAKDDLEFCVQIANSLSAAKACALY